MQPFKSLHCNHSDPFHILQQRKMMCLEKTPEKGQIFLADGNDVHVPRRQRKTMIVDVALIGALIWLSVVNLGWWARLSDAMNPLQALGNTSNTSNSRDDQVIDIFEVSPVLPDYSASQLVASAVLVDHVFGNSYGQPFRGEFVPPANVDFNRVRASFSSTTYGRQFDRLAHLFVGGNEIWRLSTAEPGNKNISFGFTKDIDRYASLFKEKQDIEFYLDNIVNDVYSGPISFSLMVEFYKVEDDQKAGYELPVTTPATKSRSLTDSKLQHFSGDSHGRKIQVGTLPRNTTRVVVEVFASGNANEEFWYSHLADPHGAEYQSHLEYGPHGSIREVQLLVDGELAGTCAPYHIIYTGGYSPMFWSPMVGTKTYDVPSYLIDITSFLPTLWEQDSTEIEIRLANPFQRLLADNWIVSANLLTWEQANWQGRGEIIPIHPKNPKKFSLVLGKGPGVLRQILNFGSYVSTAAELTFDNDEETVQFLFEWDQVSTQSSIQSISSAGEDQNIVADGDTTSKITLTNRTGNSTTSCSTNENSALVCQFTYTAENDKYDFGIVRSFEQKIKLNNEVTSDIGVTQNGTSTLEIHDRAASGFASLDTKLRQKNASTKYKRHVKNRNGTIVFDTEHIGDQSVSIMHSEQSEQNHSYFARLPRRSGM